MKFEDVLYILCSNVKECEYVLNCLHKKGYVWKTTNNSLLDYTNFDKTKNGQIIYKLDHKNKSVQFIKRKINNTIKYDEFRDLMKKENYVYTKETGYPLYVSMFNEDKIKRIIFNDDRTIVIMENGSKGISQCSDIDIYDEFTGFYVAYYRAIKNDIRNDKLDDMFNFVQGKIK